MTTVRIYCNQWLLFVAACLLPSCGAQELHNDNSCMWAHDGTCDEERWAGTGVCTAGSDSADCATRLAASHLSEDCCGDFEPSNKCCPSVPVHATSSTSSSSSSSSVHCSPWLYGDFCDPWSAATDEGLPVFFIVLLLLGCCFFPLIVFGITYCTCIQSKQTQGRSPTAGAWTACCLVFWVAVFFGSAFFGLFSWIGCSFLMIIPFLIDDCYTQPRGGGGGLYGHEHEMRMVQQQQLPPQMVMATAVGQPPPQMVLMQQQHWGAQQLQPVMGQAMAYQPPQLPQAVVVAQMPQ